MRVAISGSTGLLGARLAADLERDGHTIHPVVRQRDRAVGSALYWSPSDGAVDADGFAGLDAVVHLAGAPIGKRWTPEHKRRIRDSRIEGTRLLAEALASLDDPPGVLVSASAIGYYGDRGDEVLTEDDDPGNDFLAVVCHGWELAAEPADEAGIRVVHPRTGIVLAEDGPAMEKLLPPFKLGLGGPVGSGRQYVSWIAVEDHIRALRHLIDDDRLRGGVNLTGPQPVTNAEFSKALGGALHRPAVLRVPGVALRLLFGEMGTSLALTSQRVMPKRLLDSGFEFRHHDVRGALDAALA